MNNYSKEYDEVYKEIENILSGGMDSQLSLLLDGAKKYHLIETKLNDSS